ncbi:MAG: oligosaccharide flippase family protein [Bacteroidetes bacterium]|nr:oligosaccharide flippase family protein [Bacteroidota bacterium]
MSGIKKLAGQTLWYGLSSIAARLINYLLTPYLTYKLSIEIYGEQSLIYSFIPFMNVVFTYGMETAFFRFSNNKDQQEVYNTTSISLIISTLFLSTLLILFRTPIAMALQIDANPEYIILAAAIIGIDALCGIPFAKLRQENKPLKFAFIKIGGILVVVFTTYFFISVCPSLVANNPTHWMAQYYRADWAVGYILLANLIQNIIVLLLLSKEFFGFEWKFNKALWKEIMVYSLPLIIVGFGGMINEVFDRLMLGWLAPVSSLKAAKTEVAIYSACYKLSILITLAVQAFRMGAEPFFFKQSQESNAPKIYARVMKLFVITLCFMFLMVVLYLDIWKQFIRNPNMWVGLQVVPILLLANMFLGIYYNLSVWYKLSNKTMAGALITIIGAAITLCINWFFIPYYSYLACAWATFSCYGTMMVISFIWGQKAYPIPYAWKKLVAYIVIVVAIFFIQKGLLYFYDPFWFKLSTGTLLLIIFTWFILLVEKKEFKKLPVVGKYI